jgi:lipopolysaccharide/colanic/teichoic acid biosynthesis glycosyltransferase
MISEAFKSTVRGGYFHTTHVFNRIFNIVLALIFLVICAPLVGVISLFVLMCDGRPVFYKGIRMGFHKKPFMMYKFRTLAPDAEQIIGAQLLATKHKLVTPLGKFLRDTRLDELPQLYNVLRGDIDFIGPRPERPLIYDHICSHIRDYDRRFEVNPGLIGYAQLFTPHNSPKRIRTLIDNKLVRRKQVLFWDVYAVLFTGFIVVKTTLIKMASGVYHLLRTRGVFRVYHEKRELERIRQEGARVYFWQDAFLSHPLEGVELVDINEEAFLMSSSTPLVEPWPRFFKLEISLGRRHGRLRRKRCRCEGEMYREIKGEDAFLYVVRYKPVSPLNYYMVHQYFLRESIA